MGSTIKPEKLDLDILLVEDDAIDAILFFRFSDSFLRYRPHTTHVRNIDSALDALENKTFDVCFLDFWLNGQSSLKFLVDLECRNIRAPTVILSNISPHQVETLRMTSGGAIFLNKGDCSAKTLEAAVEDALALARVSHGDVQRARVA